MLEVRGDKRKGLHRLKAGKLEGLDAVRLGRWEPQG